MLLSEQEAKTKWCPYTRVYDPKDEAKPVGFNWMRWDPSNGEMSREDWQVTACKGSVCMAWRWADPDKSDRGFCGLAGTP